LAFSCMVNPFVYAKIVTAELLAFSCMASSF